MPIESGLRTLLLTQSSITTLVPSQVVEGTTYYGIFNEYPEEGFKLPFILISQVSFDPYVTLDGTAGMGSYEIDIDCYANKYSTALAIADAVTEFLKDYSGSAGSNTINAVIWLGKRHDRIFEGQGRKVIQNIVSLSYQIQGS